jgi:hypothetical protein
VSNADEGSETGLEGKLLSLLVVGMYLPKQWDKWDFKRAFWAGL